MNKLSNFSTEHLSNYLSRFWRVSLLVAFGLVFTFNYELKAQNLICEDVVSSECDEIDFGCDITDDCRICLTGSEDEDITSHLWVFKNLDDGTTQSMTGQSVCFDRPGIVNATVWYFVTRVDDDGNTTTQQCLKTFEFIPCGCETFAGFSVVEIDGCKVTFESDNGIGTHTWDFGDGTTSNEVNPIHQFIPNGTSNGFLVSHTVKLSATEIYTCTKLVFPKCILSCGADGVDFVINGLSCGRYSFVVTVPVFDFLCDDGSPPEYLWDFGNGTPLVSGRTDPNNNHHEVHYPNNGAYTVTLYVKCGDQEIEIACSRVITVNCHDEICNSTCDFIGFFNGIGDACSELILTLFSPCQCDPPGSYCHEWTIENYDGTETTQLGPNLLTPSCISQDITLDNPWNSYLKPTMKVTHNIVGSPTPPCPEEKYIELPEGIFIGCQCIDDDNKSNQKNTISSLIDMGVLPPGGVDGNVFKNIYLNSTLIVDIDYFFSNVNLNMGIGALITVKNGATLDLSSGTVAGPSNGCNCMWVGIEVEEGGILNVEDSSIEKAVYGIRLKNLAMDGMMIPAPELIMNNSNMISNYVGIVSVNGPVLISEFSGNSIIGGDVGFTCDCLQEGDIIPHIGSGSDQTDPISGKTVYKFTVRYSFTGMFFDGSSGTSLILPPGDEPNRFLDLPYGIIAVNTNAEIRNCKFENIHDFEAKDDVTGLPVSYSSSGLEFGDAIIFQDLMGGHTINQFGLKNEISFKNCVKGINVLAGGSNTKAWLYDNEMTLVEKGIDIISSTGNVSIGQIRNNDIKINKSFSSAVPEHGIFINDDVQEPSRFTLTGNSVTINEDNAQGNGIIVQSGIPDPILGVNPTTRLIMSNNDPVTIVKGKTGIQVRNINYIQLMKNNRVDIQDESTNEFAAIEIEDGSFHNVICNHVTNSAANGKNNGHLGFKINAASNSNYKQNSASDFADGIRFENNCGIGNDIAENQFLGNMFRGLTYDAMAVTGHQINKGNHWGNPNATFNSGAYHFAYDPMASTNVLVNQSIYVVHASQSPPNPTPPFGEWFYDQVNINGTTHTGEEANYTGCGSGGNPPVGSMSLNSLDNLIASDENIFSEGNLFESQKRLFTKLSLEPSLLPGNTLMQDFYNTQAESSIGELYNIQKNIQELYVIDQSTAQMLTDLDNLIETDFNLISSLLEQIRQNPEDETLKDQWSSLNTVLTENIEEQQGISRDLQSTRIIGAAGILDENNLIATTGVADANEKLLNRIYLEVFIMKQRQITEDDKFAIEGIANQCYAEGGAAVFRARSWHYQLSGIQVNTSQCGSTFGKPSKIAKIGVANPKLIVKPNPNSGQMRILFTPLNSEGYSLEIFDILGRQIEQFQLSSDQISQEIEISDALSGMYFAVLKKNSRKITSTSFIVR